MRPFALSAVALFSSALGFGGFTTTGPETCIWVSHKVNGGQAELGGIYGSCDMSADGSVIVWSGYNLESTWLTGDRFGHVYLWERATDTVVEIGAGNWSSDQPRVSADGRYVVFHSSSSNLVAGDTNNQADVFRYDRQEQVMLLVGVGDQGQQPINGDCSLPDISGDGNLVVFQSGANNLVPGSSTPHSELFLRDIAAGTTTRIADTDGVSDSWLIQPRISADGKVVCFASQATTLVPGRNDESLIDVYAVVLATGAIERISVGPDGASATCSYESVWSHYATISADGRYVSFASNSNSIVTNDTNVVSDIFVRDRVAGTTVRVSVTNQGIEANSERDSDWSEMSADGRFVVFSSQSDTLIAGDTGWADIFVRDTVSGITERVSMSTTGEPGNAHNGLNTVAISADGRLVAFTSTATNLSPNDGVGQVNPHDIYLYTRNDETASATLSAAGSLTTDSESDGSIASDPVETTIQAGADGDYAITETINTGTPPAGEYWLTREIRTTGSLTSASSPHRLTFEVDASRLPQGFGLPDLKVYKDGTRVPESLGATEANPDPCITSREILGNGDLRVVCLTTSMGIWDIGDPTYQFQGFVGVNAYPAANEAHAGAVIHVEFSIGADLGLDIFRSTPEGALYPISGEMDNPDDPRNFVGGDTIDGSGEMPFTFRRGNYTYAWKTDPSWRGTYRLLTIGLKNGITARLKFKFK